MVIVKWKVGRVYLVFSLKLPHLELASTNFGWVNFRIFDLVFVKMKRVIAKKNITETKITEQNDKVALGWL